MKGDKVFVDTNIIVYAYDKSAGRKHLIAVETLDKLWDNGQGVISTQVLQEFFVTVTRKIPLPLSISVAKGIVNDLLSWKTVLVDGSIILDAIDLQCERQLSYWDAVIMASAMQAGARNLLSEDFSTGSTINRVTIINPFAGL